MRNRLLAKEPLVTLALFRNLVDYAGLFPPARLDMTAAAREYAVQCQSDDAWILARFIVPVSRLDELAATARGHQKGEPWPLSVLAVSDHDRARIDAFNEAHVGRLVAESVETRATTPEEVAERARTFSGLELYVEIANDEDPNPLMDALARSGGRAKIRTGGITEGAFPSSAEVARFVCAAARAGVAFKATAGLHHALRGEYRLTYEDDSPSGTMHGFLNVFLAAALVRDAGIAEGEVVALLEECDAAAFTLTDTTVGWRGHEIDARALAAVREGFATSYGSCSFREPIGELRALALLD